ncbi:MAG: hypothetical protein V4813_05785 [Gemmatimonadota bacterium]
MTRSIKALSAAAMLLAIALPATASAQDTTSTGGRTKSDSASGRSMTMQRFDTTQAISLTGVTIVRLDSIAGGKGAWNSSAHSGMAAGASGAMGAGSSAASPKAQGPNHNVSALVSSGADSMQVLLGPADFLASNQLTLAAGDVINVKGVRLTADAGVGAGASAAATTSSSAATTIGATASAVTTTVLATEITKGDKTVQLRDKSTGAPKWSAPSSDAGMSRSTLPPAKTDSVISPVRKP